MLCMKCMGWGMTLLDKRFVSLNVSYQTVKGLGSEQFF